MSRFLWFSVYYDIYPEGRVHNNDVGWFRRGNENKHRWSAYNAYTQSDIPQTNIRWHNNCCMIHFIRATLTSAGISGRRVSVRPCVRLSITSRCSTETAKHRITQTTPYDSPETLFFCCRQSRQNSNGVTPNGGAKCRLGMLNAGTVGENWRLSTRHRASTLFVCSTFAVMQRVARFVSDIWSLFYCCLGRRHSHN